MRQAQLVQRSSGDPGEQQAQLIRTCVRPHASVRARVILCALLRLHMRTPGAACASVRVCMHGRVYIPRARINQVISMVGHECGSVRMGACLLRVCVCMRPCAFQLCASVVVGCGAVYLCAQASAERQCFCHACMGSRIPVSALDCRCADFILPVLPLSIRQQYSRLRPCLPVC